MIRMINKLKKYSVIKIWFISLVIFLGSTLVLTIVDFIGERWLKVTWPSGPDLFPNQILGYPLFVIQLLALALLITAGAKTYTTFKGIKGALLSLILILSTGISCFFTYAFLAFWYQFELMGRSM